jgi:hypothetical protein
MLMSISYVAMNRIIEERAAQDEEYCRQLKRVSKCTLSDGRRLSDEALVDKLRSLGLTEFDRDWLDRFSRKVPSSQVLATALTEHGGLEVPPDQEDWLWIALVCLWERWFPDRPNFELLDDWMQAGYDARERDEPLETARLWRRVWDGVQSLMTGFEIGTIEEFDDWFGGTNCVFNWVQDYSSALYRAALTNRSFAQERLDLCRTVQNLAAKTERDKSLVDRFRRDLAESLADLGDYESVDNLYTEWLRDDPQWGWGWIGWSDVYYTFAPEGRSEPARAERILSDGLAIPEVRDREYLVDRLADLYKETGRTAEAAALRDRHGDPSESAGEASREPVGETSRGASDAELDAIIAELDAEFTGKLPEQAIRAAQRHRAEITPRLIELIRKATEAVRAGNDVTSDGAVLALFLLTEFEAKEALPVILEAVSLPDDGPLDLFGDGIIDDLASILAALADDAPEVVADVITNRSFSDYIRSAAAGTYLHWVRDGRWTREQAVQRLREHLDDAIRIEDLEGTTGLIWELASYAAHEAWGDIQEAFRRGLVDEGMISLDYVRRNIARGESRFRESLESCGPTGVPDTVDEVRSWASYQDEDQEEDDDSDWRLPQTPFGSSRMRVVSCVPDPDYQGPVEPVATIRNTSQKVGRNDPCPCGSGKKYKKCCGAK